MIDKQSKNELRIFRRFASLCYLPIVTESIEKRNPPEPDIICNVRGIGTVAFELTELIDRDFANMLGKQIKTKDQLNIHYSNLDGQTKDDFFRKYSDAIIFVQFNNSLSMKKRVNLFPSIFQHLLSLKDGFEGDTLRDDYSFKGKLKYITISRGLDGPIFDEVPVTTVGDPTIPSVKAKFSKQYSINCPLHLLLYIDLNPMFPDHIWLPSAVKYLKLNINQSQFDKIWIFDFNKNKIQYECP